MHRQFNRFSHWTKSEKQADSLHFVDDITHIWQTAAVHNYKVQTVAIAMKIRSKWRWLANATRLLLMFEAPSYPWPTIQEIVRPEFSTADKIASAICSPVILSSCMKLMNSSRMLWLASTKLKRKDTSWDVSLSVSTEKYAALFSSSSVMGF